jgi:hypothetical protein
MSAPAQNQTTRQQAMCAHEAVTRSHVSYACAVSDLQRVGVCNRIECLSHLLMAMQTVSTHKLNFDPHQEALRECSAHEVQDVSLMPQKPRIHHTGLFHCLVGPSVLCLNQSWLLMWNNDPLRWSLRR